MWISYFVKSRLVYLENCCLAALTICFLNLAEVRVHLVQPENDLLRARLSALKVGETFIDFSRASLS